MRKNVAAMRASLADQRAANAQRAQRAADAAQRVAVLKVRLLSRVHQLILYRVLLEKRGCAVAGSCEAQGQVGS